MVAGSTTGQGVGEWVGTLLWWGGVFAGMAVLCVALVWTTQEGWVALPSGGYRWIPRHGPHSPWMRKLWRLMEHVGAWLMKITRPMTGLSQEEGRRRTHTTERREEPNRRGEATWRSGHPDQNPGVLIRTNGGQLYPMVTNLDSGVVGPPFPYTWTMSSLQNW
ncbi:hypothetical protein DFH08DRAFT_823244 [Mycena albidolilacea]|uniref:Uncharacterized protein n=1 Tax=Mycena albidolilacea TaxID=1033008 RepID=A0AAD7EC70_9AGAR|nr:hypothetical protein DFH08DRAFT_823244 [Mycena albidolilacea]